MFQASPQELAWPLDPAWKSVTNTCGYAQLELVSPIHTQSDVASSPNLTVKLPPLSVKFVKNQNDQAWSRSDLK